LLWEKDLEKGRQGLFTYLLYLFIGMVKIAECVALGIVDHSDM
jgi:hypothetical protein